MNAFQTGYEHTRKALQTAEFQDVLNRYNGAQCHPKSEFPPWDDYWKGALQALRETGRLKED